MRDLNTLQSTTIPVMAHVMFIANEQAQKTAQHCGLGPAGYIDLVTTAIEAVRKAKQGPDSPPAQFF